MRDQGSPEETPDQRATVVVIDDEMSAHLQVELALERSSLVRIAGQAQNARRGISLVGEVQPAVVVLDLAMPGMDGYEALPLLRTAAPAAAIVVHSSLAAEAAERVAEMGAVRCVSKFVSPIELCQIIEDVASTHHASGADPHRTVRRTAQRNSTFRVHNEAISSALRANATSGDRYEFMCECSRFDCAEMIALTLAEYEAVRAHEARSCVAPDHAIAAFQTTVERHERYWVVARIDPTPPDVSAH